MQIKIAKLMLHHNPYKYPVWGNFTVSKRLVTSCIYNNLYISIPVSQLSAFQRSRLNPRRLHAMRIAYLVLNYDKMPIDLDVGIPEMGYFNIMILDGFHRIAAAIYRRDEYINADISGSVAFAKRAFG